MSAKFEIHATNSKTSVLVAEKYTLGAALIMATELMETWDDIFIRERVEGSDVYKVVAKVSAKGLFI